jgi:hypothetical protein
VIISKNMDGDGEERNEEIKVHTGQKMQQKYMALLMMIINIFCTVIFTNIVVIIIIFCANYTEHVVQRY